MNLYAATLSALTLAVLVQLACVWLAWMQIGQAGRYRLVWVMIGLALFLMLDRRLQPLTFTLQTGLYDGRSAATALLVSLLWLGGLVGLRALLRDLQNQEKALRQLATHDDLTGLANRRHVLDFLRGELRRQGRTGHPLSVLLLDVDRFKRINDQFGHAAGDQAIIAVADACRADLRATDLCGRIGGEEFLVVLPETNGEAALVAAERLRERIATGEVQYAGQPIRFTASIGVATREVTGASPAAASHATDDDALSALLREVDTAVYAAKSLGRNRCQAWRPGLEISPS